MDQWHPIETAPRGEDVLLARYDDDGSYWTAVGQWWVADFAFMFGRGQNPVLFDFQPTHWMRLPAPPSSRTIRG